jgi:hypothetical protein
MVSSTRRYRTNAVLARHPSTARTTTEADASKASTLNEANHALNATAITSAVAKR